MDEIITWIRGFVYAPGFIVIIGMAIWAIVKTIRSRFSIHVTVSSVTDKVIKIAADNKGRKPVNVVGAGFMFANDSAIRYPDNGQIFPHCLFSKKRMVVDFDINIIKDKMKKDKTVINFIYFTDEAGHLFKGSILLKHGDFAHGTN